jgi:very-short-patch-repair endonuclease
MPPTPKTPNAILLAALGQKIKKPVRVEVQQKNALNKKKASRRTDAFVEMCLARGIPAPDTEHQFLKERKFRFDFAWPDLRVAVEMEGIVIGGQGRHQTAIGYERDCEKYNLATLNGWRILRYTPKKILLPATLEEIGAFIEQQ